METLTAGPELDSRVARALGCAVEAPEPVPAPQIARWRCACEDHRHAENLEWGREIGGYSTDVAAALAALESKGAWMLNRSADGVTCTVIGNDTNGRATAATAPLAICAAILAATEGA